MVVVLVIAGTAASAWAWFRFRSGLAFACFVGAMAVGLATVEKGFLLYAPYRSVAKLASLLRSEIQPGEQIMIEGRYEHHAGIAFYSAQQVGVYRGLQGILMNGTRYTGTKGTFISDEEFGQLWKGSRRAYLLSDSSATLYRLRSLAPETTVLGRTGNSWLFANRDHKPGGTGSAWSQPQFAFQQPK